MSLSFQQAYRHLVQEHSVRQMLRSQNTRRGGGKDGGWEAGGIFALFSAAAFCGTLAQLHLG